MTATKRVMTRRAALRRGGIGLSAIFAAPLVAGAGQEEAGPAVWLDMDQEALDDAYSQSVYAPNIRQVIARYRWNSERARSRLGNPEQFRYGSAAIESMDVFRAAATGAPIHVFIHGGAWQEGAADTYAFLAENFVNEGIHYVVPDFSWVQDVEDSLFPIVDQLQRAIAWVYENAPRFGGDRERIFLSGHSSGAHLAGVLLTTDWRATVGLPQDVLKAGLCCSGIFDLEPVRLSSRGDYIRFTDDMENALSPLRHIDRLAAPVVVAYGSLETPEFVRQSRDFAASVTAAGKPVRLLEAKNYNHFEILETMASPYGVLGRAALDQVRDWAV
jgi:arylformamidase